MTLSTRIEAGQPSRELFEEAFEMLKPNCALPGMTSDLYVRFHHMLDAEAWTSAAEMLVGDGLRTYMANTSVGTWVVSLTDDTSDDVHHKATATRPATALLAAVVRANETGGDDGTD